MTTEVDAAPDPGRDAVWTRGILPLALPLLAAFGTAVWVVNLSRAFLASGKWGALAFIVGVSVAILVGASVMSAMPHLRGSSQLLLAIGLAMFVVSAGLVSLGRSEEGGHEAAATGGYQEPSGPAVATVEVDALPSLKFQATEFRSSAGVNLIKYNDKGGTHTLVFDVSKYQGFKLEVPPDDSGKIDLAAGEYVIYCDVPGHRAAGMEATLIVE